MNYATVAELRSEYATGALDEFAARLDEELLRALVRASATIDRYRPTGTPTADGLAQLRSVCLPIARAYAHDELVLEETHPIVREYHEAMGWLAQLAKGSVSLALERTDGGGVTASAPVVFAPAKIF